MDRIRANRTIGTGLAAAALALFLFALTFYIAAVYISG